jgi:hypothetical protein
MKRKFMSMAAAVITSAIVAGGVVPVAAVTADGNSSYYSDMTTDYYGWAVEAVDYLTQKRIASGIGNNFFEPSSNIKRCDFVVLLNNALKLKNINTVAYGFSDVADDAYYYRAVINAKGNKVVTNVGNFYPEDDITRLDAFLMIYRALQVQGYVKGYGTTDTSMYVDEDELVNTESKIAIGTLTSMDILHGYDGYIYPLDTISRAEMASLIYNTVLFMEKQDETAASTTDTSASTTVSDENESAEDESTEYKTEEKAYYKPVVIDSDKTLENCSIKVSDSAAHMDLASGEATESEIEYTNAPAVTVNSNATANINNTKIIAYSIPQALRVSSNSTVKVYNSQITGSSTEGVSVNDTAQVNVDNSTVAVKGNKVYAITANGGIVAVDASKISSNAYSGVLVCNDAEFSANDTEISASNKGGGAIDIKADYYDTKNGTAKVALKDVILSNLVGAALFLNNADAEITLNGGCTINAKQFIYTSDATTKKGTPGYTAKVNLNNQKVEGDVIVDDTVTMQFNINEGSEYTGSMNNSQDSVYFNVYLDENAQLNLTGDCYVAEFVRSNDEEFDFENIQDNGYTIYYDSTLEANNYLDGREYVLPQGGLLTPRW